MAGIQDFITISVRSYEDKVVLDVVNYHSRVGRLVVVSGVIFVLCGYPLVLIVREDGRILSFGLMGLPHFIPVPNPFVLLQVTEQGVIGFVLLGLLVN